MVPADGRFGRLITLASRTPDWLQPDALGEADGAKLSAAQAFPSNVRVLLVEDDPGDARLVSFSLRSEQSPSFTVTHVMTLGAAIEKLDGEAEFDVVLLDLSLPDSFGLETVSRMQEVAPRLPIVIMTGHDDPVFAAKALEAGAQDYLVKSDDPSRTVSRAIRYAMTRKTGELERQDLADRIANQQKVLMQEMQQARSMQFDLLPRADRLSDLLSHMELEVEAYFEPSTGIGGDLWGCMDAGDDRICCYAFDFSGHGIGAALNVFRLHALIAEHWQAGLEPAQVLHTLGAALNGLLRRGQFATMVLGVIDCRANMLHWSSAGAPSPLLISRGKAEFLESRGVPLGLQKQPSYTAHSVPFHPGDSLLLYSDCITDAMVNGDVFGEEGLGALVKEQLQDKPEFTVDGLLDAFHSISPPPHEDDLTAVRFTRLGGGR